MQVQNVYMYVKKDDLKDCLKYGMKLSKYNDYEFNIKGHSKKGITAYLSPKDSEKYNSDMYEILRIKIKDINSYVFDIENEKIPCKLEKYNLGDYINPIVFINSSIMPENIFEYNRIIDVPLLIENSKDFYFSRIESEKAENDSYGLSFSDIINKSN